MKAIILAAGLGRRMGRLASGLPKVLVDLGDGSSCLDRMLGDLGSSGLFQEAVIVTGHRADKISDFVGRVKSSMKIKTVFNPLYDISGPLVSLWIARDHLIGDDFVISNGDNVFSGGVVKKAVRGTGERNGLDLLVVEKTAFTPDEIKVRLGEGSSVKRVGKDLAGRGCSAVSAGLLVVRGAEYRRAVVDSLEEMVKAEENLWPRVLWHSLVNRLVDEGGKVGVIAIGADSWQEIDQPDDLVSARTIAMTSARG